MNRRFPKLVVITAFSLALWVMPSVGTQGMGTIGQRFTHPDRYFFDSTKNNDDAGRRGTRYVLQDADRSVETALGF